MKLPGHIAIILIIGICSYFPFFEKAFAKNIGISRGTYKHSENARRTGFMIRREGFFRYAYENNNPEDPSPSSPSQAKTTSRIHFLDVGNTQKYYRRMTSGGIYQDTDVQLLEWPGKKAYQERKAVQKHFKERRMYCSFSSGGYHQDTEEYNDECKVWMLQFDRDNGKIAHYPCNAQEGTMIVAVAAIRYKEKPQSESSAPEPEPSSLNSSSPELKSESPPPPSPENEEDEDESPQKIWLAHGTKSIYTSYIQPMFVPETVLLEMARPSSPGSFCAGPDDDFTSNTGSKLLDLRTVHDFTFTRGRLILGMECGIIVVSGLTKDNLTYEVATLQSESGIGKNLFPEPINKVSASVCCSLTNDCSGDHKIVAAYSYSSERECDANKFIYVSFDLGSTFIKKLIADRFAYMNLIVGMYKAYSKWHHYYEVLNNPDEDDILDEDEFLKNMRAKPTWDSSTTEGKEKLFGVGVTIEERKKSSLRTIAEILRHQVPKREQRIKKKTPQTGNPASILLPGWIKTLSFQIRKNMGWEDDWTDENCESIPKCNELFVTDKHVRWLLNVTVKTPNITETEITKTCFEITSLIVLPEERQVMALCRVLGIDQQNRNGETEATLNQSPQATVNQTSSGSEVNHTCDKLKHENASYGFFAFFKFPIQRSTPLTHGVQVSQRVFQCKFISSVTDGRTRVIQPELIRIPGSVTIFVTNCKGAVFVTTNFGNTLFNAAFYFEKEKIKTDCDAREKEDQEAAAAASNMTRTTPSSSPDTSETSESPETTTGAPGRRKRATESSQSGLEDQDEECGDKPTLQHPHHVRSFELCALNVPPMITAGLSGSMLVMTFGRFFARGAIAYNRETRLVVSEALVELARERRFENIVFPGLDPNGALVLAISLTHAYSVPDTKFRNVLYKTRHAMRLVQMPFNLYWESRDYQQTNLVACNNAQEKGLTFPYCETISFSVNPKRLDVDLGESQIVSVNVKDDNPYLPLWIFSSNGNSVGVKAYYNIHTEEAKSSLDEISSHNWDVEISVKPNQKNVQDGEHLVDAFFGSDYNRYHDYSCMITLVNTPNLRCHVQPTATVNVEIGCKGKKLVAHEDEHRPQCRNFRQFFNYTLKKGTFDPELAHYWLKKESEQSQPLFKIMPNGDLSVVYDYARWGCPLEPYASDNFLPELRITEPGQNSTYGKKFKGMFVLVEIFGAKGFSYSKKLKDLKELHDCPRKPRSLKDRIEEWKRRRRLFQVASERLVFPNTTADLSQVNWLTDVRGNQLFANEAVQEHINIWNRANFIDCHDVVDRNVDHGVSHDELEEESEIMKNTMGEEDSEEDEISNTIKVGQETMKEDDSELTAEEEDATSQRTVKDPNKIVWGQNRQRVYIFLAVAIDEYGSLCNYQTFFGVSLKGGAVDINDIISFLIFFLFVIFWILLMLGGYFMRRSYLRVSYINQARIKKLEQAAWTVVYRYEKMIHDKELRVVMQEQDADTVKEKKSRRRSRKISLKEEQQQQPTEKV